MKNILFVNFLDDKYLRIIAQTLEQMNSDHINCYYLSFKNNINFKSKRKIIFTNDLIGHSKLLNNFTCKRFKILENNVISNKEIEKVFFRSIDRVFLNKRSQDSQKKYLNKLKNFWGNYLSEHKISCIVFDSTPHMPWDLVLFFISKNLGIKTIIKRRTYYSNLIMFSDDFRSNKTKFYSLNKIYQGDIEDSNNNMYSNLIERSEKINKSSSFYTHNKFADFLKFISKLILIFFSFRNEKIYFKLNKIQSFKLNIKRYTNRRSSIKFYMKNSINPNLNKNYIYFPLHFRPERSTVPEGGNYYDQFSAIKKISKIIPSNYFIYIKEHPRQLGDASPDLRRALINEKLLYKKLLTINQVRLIKLNFDSSALIKNSCLVCSITGSSVWQGVLNGIPGVTFGNTWHSGFIFTPDVSNDKNLPETINKLLKLKPKYLLDSKRNYLSTLRKNLSLGASFMEDALSSKFKIDFLIENHIDNLNNIISERE